MSADGRIAAAAPTAADLESAPFVRIVARPDGDALAAGGILARALAAVETPFQVSVARTVAERTARVDDERAPSDVGLAIGAVEGDRPRLDPVDRPATLAACDLARELGVTPDPTLALAGVVAAGLGPDAGEAERLLSDALERGDVERRPGLAIPTADPIDGLAHSTRVSAPWSGDRDAVREALSDVALTSTADVEPGADAGPDGSEADLADDDRRAIASVVAIDAVSAPEASEVAAESLAGALRPYATPEGVFETIGGYADVLEATARVEPGTGVALAMGHHAREAALAAWREHGRRTHAALEAASTGRYAGLCVVGVENGPIESVARLAADYRSPEPATLALGDGEAALALRERGPAEASALIEDAASEIARETDETASDVGRLSGYFRYDRSADDATIITAVRGTL